MNEWIFPCERCGIDVDYYGTRYKECNACLAILCEACAEKEIKDVPVRCFAIKSIPYQLIQVGDGSLCSDCHDREFWYRGCKGGCQKECYKHKRHVKEEEDDTEFVKRICWVVKEEK